MTGKRIWQLKKTDEKTIRLLQDALGISRVIATILCNRGICNPEEARRFLAASLSDLQSANEIPGIPTGARRIQEAIQKEENILVYGDYDVDGITGTALLTDLLRRLGGKVNYYIPHRIDEGYGLNTQALLAAKEAGTDLIVTVDCGISSLTEADFLCELGIDLVISDHHELPQQLPKSLSVINPKLADDSKPWSDLSGVGVAFKLGQAVAVLFSQEQFLEQYLDLVALGTIADIVALCGENRVLVKAGLAQINQQNCRPGLRCLIESAGLKGKEITAGQVGFVIAPRLNACGRLGKADLAVRLFLSTDLSEIADICRALEEENKKRRQIEEKIYREALVMLEKEETKASQSQGRGQREEKLIFLASPDWHTGVLGIVASRLKEKYYRPTILLNLEEGTGKGSGRSIPGFHLYKALDQVKERLLKFGGHEMAAGLSVLEEEIPHVQSYLQEYARTVLDERTLSPQIQLEAEVALAEINEQLIQEIELLEPFGQGNPSPLFAVRNVCLKDLRKVGKEGKHLQLKIEDQNRQIEGIAFQWGEKEEDIEGYARCDLAFKPQLNTYKGVTRVQIQLQDIKNHFEPDDPYLPLAFLEQLYFEGEIWLEDDNYRDIIAAEQFYTKVVGVTFAERQKIIQEITAGETVEIRREADNPYDANAIAIYYQDCLIGYLKAQLAKHLAPSLDRGYSYQATVAQITGQDQESLGVNICLQKSEENQNTTKTLDDQESVFFCREKQERYTSEQINEKIRSVILGEADYYPKQKEAIAHLENDANTLLILATGRGKSAVFQTMAASLALKQHKATIIVYPLRSLVNDQYQRLQEKMAKLGVRVTAINGSMNKPERKQFFRDLELGQVEIILTTPEFLVFHLDRFKAIKEKIGLFVIDEAHHLAKSKRKGYRLLGRTWEELGKPLALAVTATAAEETARCITTLLGCTQMVVENYVRENLQVVDQRKVKDKFKYLLKLVDTGERIVIYVNSRKQAYQLASDLRFYYPAAREKIGFYHGGLYSQDRVALENMFRAGELRVMVTTSAFGEGIDIPDIKHVVLYHLCFSLTEFNQLSGRAGRNQEEAKIHLLFNERDQKLNELILQGSAPSREVLGKFYLFLRDEYEKKGNPLMTTNQDFCEGMSKQGYKSFQVQTASACLGILEDVGLIERKSEGRQRLIYYIPPPSQKLDLADSLRYVEGRDEWEEFKSFALIALKEEEEIILARINRPLVPVQDI